jgi:D,D-heptose 1,7-bisphosphate phosphatase
MANRAVFLDRDHTLIEDPGYINDPALVRLLPGVDLALKWLAQAGFKVIVATNQSGVARGLISEAQLEQVHQELLRQLQEKGARLDAIYYCPYHPEGTVERYAVESPLRKPQPGMLLEAARQHDLDLGASWMVGDGSRDIEAGQRAGCRTIRVRSGHEDPESQASPVQADFGARNLVDAAKLILQQDRQPAPARTEPSATPVPGAAAAPTGPSADLAGASQPPPAQAPQADRAGQGPASAPVESAEAPRQPRPPAPINPHQFRRELLGYVRQIARAGTAEEFNPAKLVGGIVQILALVGLLMTLWKMIEGQTSLALMWGQVTMVGQLMALTLFVLARK